MEERVVETRDDAGGKRGGGWEIARKERGAEEESTGEAERRDPEQRRRDLPGQRAFPDCNVVISWQASTGPGC